MAPEIRLFRNFFNAKHEPVTAVAKRDAVFLAGLYDNTVSFFRNRKLYRDLRETDPWHLLEEFNNSDFYP